MAASTRALSSDAITAEPRTYARKSSAEQLHREVPLAFLVRELAEADDVFVLHVRQGAKLVFQSIEVLGRH